MKQRVTIVPPDISDEFNRQTFQEFFTQLATTLFQLTFDPTLGHLEIDDTDSPYTVTRSDEIIYIDTTTDNVTVTLPETSRVLYYNKAEIILKKKVAGNTVTINRSGSDTIDEGTSYTLSSAGEVVHLRATDGQWLVIGT